MKKIILLLSVLSFSFGATAMVERVDTLPEGAVYRIDDVEAESFIITVDVTQQEGGCFSSPIDGVEVSSGFAGGYFFYPITKEIMRPFYHPPRDPSQPIYCTADIYYTTYGPFDVEIDSEADGTEFTLPLGMRFLGLKLK